MKRAIFFILGSLICQAGIFGQTLIQGVVKDSGNEKLPGVNVMIRGSFDGSTTDADGNFYFHTHAQADQIIVASSLGYKTWETPLGVTADTLLLEITLQADRRSLDAVVISAGTFEAGDQKKSVTLRPIDIVTTPSATGDIYGMLTTLPGTAAIGEDGRLFVRGGDGYESKTFIDGLMVRKPYTSSLPGLPSRGRFSPFLFSGTTFSTGGYSAEYGQALSSALILNADAFPKQTQTELSLMSTGLGITQSIRKKDHAFSIGAEYTNMQPYFSLVRQSHSWNRHPQGPGGHILGHMDRGNKGIYKFFATYNGSVSGLHYPDFSGAPGAMQDIVLKNTNLYGQLLHIRTVRQWLLKVGLSAGNHNDRTHMKSLSVKENYGSSQARVSLSRSFSEHFNLKTGIETAYTGYEYAQKQEELIYKGAFNELLSAVYVETESRPLSRLALRTGLRHEYSSVLDGHASSWRISAAWFLNPHWQVSLASGTFYQTPEESVLRNNQSLDFEKALHLIANLQYERNKRLLRAEVYHKKYNQLVSFTESNYPDPQSYNNKGFGQSSGLDLFFRDRESFANLDYWVSYSFVDARRLYRSYPMEVRPPFAPSHSMTLVAKHWIRSINLMPGASLSLASGRPYHNPNLPGFMSATTPWNSNLSINFSHLRQWWGQQLIIYSSLSNVLGSNTIYGYRYFRQADQQGYRQGVAIEPPAKRFAFVGIFITIQ